MNCDDFLSYLDSRDEAMRAQARNHATECVNCAALAEVSQNLRQLFTPAEKLPKSARQCWERAATLSRRRSGPKQRNSGSLIGLAATLLVACGVIVHFSMAPRDAQIPDRVNVPLNTESVIAYDPKFEFTRLKSSIDDLDSQLSRLSEQIDRLEVEQEIQRTLVQFANR